MRLAITVLVVLLLASMLISNTGVFAIDGGSSALTQVLNQSKTEADQKIADMQNAGLTVPDEANSQYSQGLAEYQTATGDLNTDPQGTKLHALKAMDLFKNVIQLIGQQQNSTSNDANQTAVLVQSITDSENNAAKIRALVQENGISTSIFTDYDNAINMATASVAKGDYQSATQQLSIAQDLLDKVYQKLENQAQAGVDSRANQFLKNTKATLYQMIQNAKNLGLSQSTIDALQGELDKLNDITTATQIIDATNQSSQLQDTTDQYNNQRLTNFAKESARIQHVIETLQTMSDQNNLQFAGIAQLSQTLDDIKQKIANGQTDDAASELDQEDSLLASMNDVVNGGPSIMQDINTARNMSNSLQSQAQAQNDANSLDNINQANQLLDSANSIVLNATSSGDLQSARNTLAQAQGILNSVNDALTTNQQTANQTQNSNQTSTGTNSTDNSTTSLNQQTANQTQNSNQTSTGTNSTDGSTSSSNPSYSYSTNSVGPPSITSDTDSTI